MVKQLSSATGRIWLDTVDPTSSETMIEQGNFWMNTSTKDLFICVDPTVDALVWKKVTFAA